MATLIGISGPVFGTVGDSQIIVNNIRQTSDGEWTELPDGEGRIIAFAVHGDKGTVAMDFVLRNGAAAGYLLARGAALTLPTGETHINASSEKLYVASWEKGKAVGAFMTGSLTANYSPSIS